MHTEDLVVHDCGRREAVEHIRERFPKLNTEPALAFVVEAVDPVDARTLMIPPEGERETRETYLDASTSEGPGENPPYAEEILGVLNLVRQNANGDLDGLLAPVDVIAEEEIIRLRRKSPVLEDAQQIVELPVGIACAGRISARGGTRSGRNAKHERTSAAPRTDDLDRRGQFEQHGLAQHEVARSMAHHLNLGLCSSRRNRGQPGGLFEWRSQAKE